MRAPRAARVAALAAACAPIAACGGAGSGPVDPGTPVDQVFADRCGGCHALAAAGTDGGIGPDLDDLAPDREAVLEAIRTGPGAMPENLLDDAAAARVAAFVAAEAGPTG